MLDNSFCIQGGLDPYQGAWTPELAAHLLRRISFGIKKDQLDFLTSLASADAAVAFVLNLPEELPVPPINNYNNEEFSDPDVPDGETWVYANYSEEVEFARVESWRGWWIDLMINSEANIREKMTLFWHNHFATKAGIVGHAKGVYLNNTLFRMHALGNFKFLVKAVTKDLNMLFFLNGYLNEKDAPDENYARELQELFTIGKDNPDHYTEQDVYEAARVLTGWRADYETGEVYFDMYAHDTGDKQFSEFYNLAVVSGSNDGDAELDALLDIIFDKEEVALYLCRKLYRFFVYYKVTDEVENLIIRPLAALFQSNNFELYPVLETLLKSEHFFNAANTGCFIKTPLDLIVGTLRNFNLSVPASTPWDQWVMHTILNYTSNDMLMLPGDPPDVAGWQAFRQSPSYYRVWITSDTVRTRKLYTDILSYYGYYSDNDILKIDHVGFAAQLENPEDPNMLIDEVVRILLPMGISEEKKAFLKNILLSGQLSDYYWTNAWYQYLDNPEDQISYDTVYYRLEALHQYIMSLSEFQLI